MLVAWTCGFTCLSNALAGHFTSVFMCKFPSFYMIASIGANSWINLLVTRQLYLMLKTASSLSQDAVAYQKPTRRKCHCRVFIGVRICLVFGDAGQWALWGMTKTGGHTRRDLPLVPLVFPWIMIPNQHVLLLCLFSIIVWNSSRIRLLGGLFNLEPQHVTPDRTTTTPRDLLFSIGGRLFNHVVARSSLVICHGGMVGSLGPMGGRSVESFAGHGIGVGQLVKTRCLGSGRRILVLLWLLYGRNPQGTVWH